jgi:hypothetical protein
MIGWPVAAWNGTTQGTIGSVYYVARAVTTSTPTQAVGYDTHAFGYDQTFGYPVPPWLAALERLRERTRMAVEQCERIIERTRREPTTEPPWPLVDWAHASPPPTADVPRRYPRPRRTARGRRPIRGRAGRPRRT